MAGISAKVLERVASMGASEILDFFGFEPKAAARTSPAGDVSQAENVQIEQVAICISSITAAATIPNASLSI